MQPVGYQDRRSDAVFVVGTTDQFIVTGGFALAEGRFLSAEETHGARPVCVIGHTVATNLFQHESAVANRIRISGRPYEVVGVLEKQGGLFGMQLDNQILVPIQQFTSAYWRRPQIDIQVKATSLAAFETTREELHGVVRRARRLAPGMPDDFSINTQESILKVWNRVGGSIAAGGLFITGLSLFVGGIGIMNIMFVSVAERTKEIGIRKAIGAKRRAILIQFLSEAACICLLGSFIALAIAWPTTFLISRFLPSTLSMTIVGIALLVSLMTGVISGFVPAWRAARMNPVDALRTE
jgi:putative ABC transport system permease protein